MFLLNNNNQYEKKTQKQAFGKTHHTAEKIIIYLAMIVPHYANFKFYRGLIFIMIPILFSAKNKVQN